MFGSREAKKAVREVHFGDCGRHPRKRRLYRQLLQLGYYWPTMKRDSEELVKMCLHAKYSKTQFILIQMCWKI